MRHHSILLKYIKEIFYLDLRSLAVFRIGLGLTILYNLYSLYSDIDVFYGPRGIVMGLMEAPMRQIVL